MNKSSALSLLFAFATVAVWADGTEMLGPPTISIAPRICWRRLLAR